MPPPQRIGLAFKYHARMVLPTRKLIWLLLLPAALMLIPSLSLRVGALVADLALIALAIADALASPKPRDLQVERQPVQHLSLGEWNEVGFLIRHPTLRRVRFWLTEDLDEAIEKDQPVVTGRLAPQSRAEVSYKVRPKRRGRFALGDIHLRVQSQLGLTIRQHRIKAQHVVKVYPNVRNLARYELAARRHRLSDMGLKASLKRGKGSIFESLRDYTPGDDVADIAWKATARRGKPVMRNYETDRSQNLMIVLDCGRLMTTRIEQDMTRLDHAINASILLTYVAMKQGDYVGLMAFGDRIQRYVPPIKGRTALRQMNEALYELEPALIEPDYAGACKYLALQHRKRSMLIVFTDLISPEASASLLAYMARFARRHLPICVTLRNLELEALADAAPENVEDAYAQSVAIDLLNRRRDAVARMRAAGVDVLDADPNQLTPRVLDRYLVMKQRARL